MPSSGYRFAIEVPSGAEDPAVNPSCKESLRQRKNSLLQDPNNDQTA